MTSTIKPIEGIKLDKAAEFRPYKNASGCFADLLDENELFILDASLVKPFINELTRLNQLDLIEETLQCLSQRNDGTVLKTAFPNIQAFKQVAIEMQSVPKQLKVLLDKWQSQGAHEIHIDFELKRN